MAYDEDLADRVRTQLRDQDGVTEKRMFGGLAFLVHGNMAVSASGKGGLLLRVDRAETETLLQEDGVSRFQMQGRSMDGWVHLDPSAVESEQDLDRWVRIGVATAASLPPK